MTTLEPTQPGLPAAQSPNKPGVKTEHTCGAEA